MTFTPEPTNPEWPMNVMVFRPEDDVNDIKAKIKPTEDVLKEYDVMEGTYPNIKKTGWTDWTYSSKEKHFTTQHYALLFAPGEYKNCNFEVGYYVQMAGLGKSPNEVRFTGSNSGPLRHSWGLALMQR